jgi:putative transposase
MPRGGRRKGAGRKRDRWRSDPPHRARPALSPRHPVHVVLRAQRKLSWRNGRAYHVIRRVLAHYLGRADFRVVQLSIQHDHLHLLVEAANERALRLGMQSFAIRTARALNRAEGACGKVFAHRYHATPIRTARYARHALAYVLNNWRKHAADYANGRQLTAQLDPYSSAVSFAGWTKTFAAPARYRPLPVSPPSTYLLRIGWSRHGEIDPFERPGRSWL